MSYDEQLLSWTLLVFNVFYEPRISMLWGFKWVIKYQDLQTFAIKLNKSRPLEVGGRGSETPRQIDENSNKITIVWRLIACHGVTYHFQVELFTL